MGRTATRGRVSRRANPEGQMPLRDHLREARRRLLIALVGLAVGTIVGWYLYDAVFAAIMAPLAQLREDGREAALNFGTLGSAFDTQLRISAFLGTFISSPWWLYQLWAYITPGLRPTERRYVLGFTLTGTALFLAGGALGWWIMPHAVTILTSFTPASALNLMDARVYFTFFMRLVGAFGLAFLFPLVIYGLNLMGAVRGRTLLKHWRWAVVLAFTFTALANPLPDAWSMVALAIPLIALYFLACGLAVRHDKKVDARQAAEDAALDAALAQPVARPEVQAPEPSLAQPVAQNAAQPVAQQLAQPAAQPVAQNPAHPTEHPRQPL